MYENLDDVCLHIENAVSKGLETDKQLAGALGWSLKKLQNWKYGKRKDGKKEKAEIGKAIKRGQNRQMARSFALAEDALQKKLSYHTVTETTQEIVKDKNGNEHKRQTKKEKVIPPSDTLIVYTLGNASRSVAENKFVSVNKVSDDTEQHKGAFLEWLEEEGKRKGKNNEAD